MARKSRTAQRQDAASKLALPGSSILTACLALILTFYPAPDRALADCQPASPANGGTVTCSGNQDTAYSVSNLGSVTVNVAAGANFNNSFSATDIGLMSMTSLGNLQALTFVRVGGLTLSLNGGNANGAITVTGANTVTIVNRVNPNKVSVDASGLLVFENFGNLNQGLIVTGAADTRIANNANAHINQAFQLLGNGDHEITNLGTVNNGILLAGNGSSIITNAAGAFINQDISSTGTSTDSVTNAGTINNAIRLGEGADVVVNGPNAAAVINGVVDEGAGADRFFMLGGTINNDVLQGTGDDVAEISGGKITRTVNTGDGSDDLLWNGGNIGALAMGADDDTAQFVNLTPANLTSGVTVDGGLGDDRLLWNNTEGAGVGRYLNWELFQLTNGSQLTFSSTLTLGDTITGSGILDIDPSSTVFAGAGSHAIVPFTGGRLAGVVNAGTIDLTNGGDSTTDRLAITGNYFGADGRNPIADGAGVGRVALGSPGDRQGDRLRLDPPLLHRCWGWRCQNHRRRHSCDRRDHRHHDHRSVYRGRIGRTL